MNRKDGGQAFPEGGAHTHRDGTLMEVRFSGGMTLRDYFAAKAMPISATFYDTSEEVRDDAAAWCYAMADAMLKARETTA